MKREFFKLLKEDHKKVKEILKSIEESKSKETKKVEELYLRLKQELTPHMEAEEKIFYSALEKVKGGDFDILESEEEHHVGKMVLKELDTLPKSDPRWTAKFMVFKEILEHHIEEEEDKVFEAASEALTDEQFEVILERFKAEKEKSLVKIK
jgi:hemerythrin-like domain-containing protein